MGVATRARLARLLIPCMVPWTAWACAAGPWVPVEDGFRNAELGYSIGRPQAAAGEATGATWQPIELPGAELGFRRGSASMSLQRRCPVPPADVSILARHLVIGAGVREFVQAGPVQLAARPAWSQVYLIAPEGGGARLRLETLTLVDGDCTLDWLLVSPADDAAARESFERWWRSFGFAPEATGPALGVASGSAPP